METTSLTFASPAWFFALVLLPAVAGLYAWAWKRNGALIAKVVAPRLRSQLAGAVSRGRRLFKAVLLLLVMALAILALARPQWGYIEREVKQRGRDVIIAVDTSRSMLATDVAPTRLARAKLVAQDLLRLVQGDRVGLVAFAGSAFLQAPLTLDQNAVLQSLDELDTNVIPKGGTNIAAAIRDALEAFGKGEGQTRALVILTDGEELDADGIAAAKKAAAEGVRIFTVGIGSSEGSLIPLKRDDGGTDFVRDSSGKPVHSRLDETRLREIAEASGGFYEPLSADVARIIFEKGILPMEMRETGEMTSRQPIERYQWPLGLATALLVLWMVLGDRRRTAAPPRRPTAAAAAALVLLSLPPVFAGTGYDAYLAGDYQKAMQDFENRLKASPDSPKLQYDAGTASYKLGDYGKAVEHFTKALLAEDKKLREDASYNLGNALVRRGEAARNKEEKKADWKNAIQHYTEALTIQPKNKRAEENREIVKKMLEELEKEEQKQDQQQQQDQQQNQDQQNQDQQQNQQQQPQNQQNKDDQQKQDQNDQQQQQNQDQAKNDQDQQKSEDQKQDGGRQGQPDQQNKDENKNDENKKDEEKKDEENRDDQGKNDRNKDQNKEDRQKDSGESDPQQGDEKDNQPQSSRPQPQNRKDEKQPAPEPTPGEKKEGELKANQEPQPASEGGQQEAEAEEKEGEMTAAQALQLLNSLRGEEERVRLMQRQQMEDTLKDW